MNNQSDTSTPEAVQATSDIGVGWCGLLAQLGFVRGHGFDGEVWTNINHKQMAQVWVMTSGEFKPSDLWWDATGDVDLKSFFEWWDTATFHATNETHSEYY